jgi:hypothetical protein
MTEEQEAELRRYLAFKVSRNERVILHHGDCVGADAAAHQIARDLGITVVVHPPVSNKKRAFCEGDQELPPKEYLVRNRDIVDASQVLVATPGGFQEKRRSGTWATVRYATCGLSPNVKCAQIIWPDGEMEDWQK